MNNRTVVRGTKKKAEFKLMKTIINAKNANTEKI